MSCFHKQTLTCISFFYPKRHLPTSSFQEQVDTKHLMSESVRCTHIISPPKSPSYLHLPFLFPRIQSVMNKQSNAPTVSFPNERKNTHTHTQSTYQTIKRIGFRLSLYGNSCHGDKSKLSDTKLNTEKYHLLRALSN